MTLNVIFQVYWIQLKMMFIILYVMSVFITLEIMIFATKKMKKNLNINFKCEGYITLWKLF